MSKSAVAHLSSWHLAVAICSLSVLFLWPTWASLHDTWFTSTRYSHGHLIVLIAAYLVFVKRDVLSRLPARPCFAALLPLAVFLVMWLIAVLASFQAIHQVLIPIILWTMLLAVLGWTVARNLLAPAAYLYLAMPIWEGGNFILQWITVKVVGIGLWVLQVPAFIHGMTINLPSGAFEVEDRCSGLHYLVVAIALSVLYGLLYLRTTRTRLLVIAAAIGMALITNWLRVFLVVYAGYLTDMQHYLITHDHYYFGWVLFAAILVPYLMFARRLERSETNEQQPATADSETVIPVFTAKPAIAFCACLLALVVSSGVVYANTLANVEQDADISLPKAQGAWAIDDSMRPNWRPYYVGASAEAFGSYVSSEGVVDAYRNLYLRQTEGKELVGYDNRVEGSEIWSIARQNVGQVKLEGTTGIWIIREIYLVAMNGQKRMLYLWYNVGGHHTASDLEAKVIYGINVLRGRSDAGVSILSSVCEQNCNKARVLLREWLAAHVPVNGET